MKMHLIFEQIFIFEIKNSLAVNWEIDNLIILLIFIKIINYFLNKHKKLSLILIYIMFNY